MTQETGPVPSVLDPEHPPPGEQPPDLDHCREIHETLTILGDRWSLIIIGQLRDRRLRFGELQRAASGISQRMLTLTLRRLEREGLIARTAYAAVPPRVEYSLTEVGSALLGPALELGRWADTHLDTIRVSRRHYDERLPE
ncbi:helix-turn-helix domain-containing protein [Streptomyces sp. DSM 44915]|uniref:Helix-turn-helix domain-containing protein n=1 Tax=Streptomyces chisholmiae TaxID=3075540 RepID=A0ABU2JM79_9ACTN|nr:helix-turn-helix domain-containing protein [Streptomyces sp. DSM 44915]MDT0266086.1 helix-turn-helix domain-containing protein [Streptomyces sp. DSM 44915]